MKARDLLRVIIIVIIIIIIIIIIIVWPPIGPGGCPQCKFDTVKNLSIAEVVLSIAALIVSGRVQNINDKQIRQ